MTDYWSPGLGQKVWLNHPDGRCLGVVVGVADEPGPRLGHPIIEQLEDDPAGMFLGKKKGDRFLCHPAFLLPMRYGSVEWQAAMEGTTPLPRPPIVSV